MRKNFGAKTVLYPMPVLAVAYDKDGVANAMTVAWGRDRGHEPGRNLPECRP